MDDRVFLSQLKVEFKTVSSLIKLENTCQVVRVGRKNTMSKVAIHTKGGRTFEKKCLFQLRVLTKVTSSLSERNAPLPVHSSSRASESVSTHLTSTMTVTSSRSERVCRNSACLCVAPCSSATLELASVKTMTSAATKQTENA